MNARSTAAYLSSAHDALAKSEELIAAAQLRIHPHTIDLLGKSYRQIEQARKSLEETRRMMTSIRRGLV